VTNLDPKKLEDTVGTYVPVSGQNFASSDLELGSTSKVLIFPEAKSNVRFLSPFSFVLFPYASFTEENYLDQGPMKFP